MAIALIHTAHGWREPRPPAQCPVGHQLGPGRVLIGTRHCTCEERLHRSATCNECGAAWYLPRPSPQCSFTDLDGRPRAGRTAGGSTEKSCIEHKRCGHRLEPRTPPSSAHAVTTT
jgi:hypothetical protein